MAHHQTRQPNQPPPDGYVRCLLPDGRNVNIMTVEGADAFVEAVPNFLETNLANSARPIRARMNANAADRRDAEMLRQLYVIFGTAANYATPDVFEEHVTGDQIDLWLAHAAEALKKLAADPRWIRTGVLEKYDQEMLDALIPCLKHYNVVLRVANQKFLHVLSDFCAARAAPDMPCSDVTESICSISNNFRVTLLVSGEKEDKIFKRLEDSGLLAQSIRCFTSPPTHPSAVQPYLTFLDKLLDNCLKIRKKFKAGSKTGDVLAAVLEGRDGYTMGTRNKEIMKRLEGLAKFCEYADRKNTDGSRILQRSCRHCNKVGAAQALQACSRCKGTFYCSKECQRADWKEHKKTCQVYSDKPIPTLGGTGMQNTMLNWLMRNYFHVMMELDRVTQESNVKKQEVLLELDFKAENGVAPAMKEPPSFKVGLSKQYFEGDRPAEPDWFYKGTDVYESNVKGFLISLRDHYNRMTSNHVLTLIRYPVGGSGVYRVQMDCEQGTNKPMFSDQALDAFSRAMRGDDSQLEAVFTPKVARSIRVQRSRMTIPNIDSDMAELSQRVQCFMNSERWKELEAGFGNGTGSDDESEAN